LDPTCSLCYPKLRSHGGINLISPPIAVNSATERARLRQTHLADRVAIIIHNYRWRLDLAQGESEYDNLEQNLFQAPAITVPAITLEGDANGAPHANDDTGYRKKFSGQYAFRIIKGGVGHNLPQGGSASLCLGHHRRQRFLIATNQ
jgi:hypothetical protein